MPDKRFFLTIILLIITAAAGSSVEARNIDLSTVPNRDTVQLTIYNSEDLTLVRETRKVSFKQGVNGLQFSWANTLIDPSSVELKFLTQRDKLEVLDTTFPHDKPQMLYWNVQSEIDGEAAIEITYFTSGIILVGRLRVHCRMPSETEASIDGLCAVSQQFGRTVRKRADAAGRGHNQVGGEDRPSGTHSYGRSEEFGTSRIRENYRTQASVKGEVMGPVPCSCCVRP